VEGTIIVSDDEIKQETRVPHEGMRDAIKEWAEEIGLDEVPKETQDILVGVFRDGWSMCMHHTMKPSRDLAMMFLQMVALTKRRDDGDMKVVLAGEALAVIEKLCHEIVGKPEGWQLDGMVEVVEVDAPEGFEHEEED
jgi:hypothetical protein